METSFSNQAATNDDGEVISSENAEEQSVKQTNQGAGKNVLHFADLRKNILLLPL